MKLTDITFAFPEEGMAAVGKVMLVGMLSDGPRATPFSLSNEKSPSQLLGKSPSTRIAEELLLSGIPSENILFYRLNGSTGSLSFSKDGQLVFELLSIGAHDRDNEVTLTVSQEGITLQSHYEEEEPSLHPNYLRTYRFDEYPYLTDLASAINQDALLGLVQVTARSHEPLLSNASFEIGQYRMSGAGSEEGYIYEEFPSKNSEDALAEEYFELFARYVLGPDYDGRSYQAIVDVPVEILAFPDLPIELIPEVGRLAAGVALQKTEEQHVLCSALFSAGPVPPILTLQEGDYLLDEETYWDAQAGEVLPYLPHQKQTEYTETLLSIYSGDERTEEEMNHLLLLVGDEVGEPVVSAMRGFLSLFLSTSSAVGLSNQRLLSFKGVHEKLSQSMVASLSANGYICVVPSVRKGTVCQVVQNHRIQTDSILSEWSHRRFLGVLEAQLARLLDPYIGKPFGFFTMTQLENGLQEILQEASEWGRLSGYKLEQIQSDPVQGIVSLQLTLSLYQEVRTIQTKIEIDKEGWELDVWNLLT